MHKYARGDKTMGICRRCGEKRLRKTMVEDGYYPNLIVCKECADQRHPQERLPAISDPVTIYKPAPDDVGYPPSLSVELDGLNSAVLSWEAAIPINARIDHYAVYRRLPAGAWTLVTTLPIVYDEFMGKLSEPLTYTDAGLSYETTYQWFVNAVTDPDGPDTMGSNIVELTTLADADPGDPVAPLLSVFINLDVWPQLRLEWTPAVVPGETITGYEIYRVDAAIFGGSYFENPDGSGLVPEDLALHDTVGDVLEYIDTTTESSFRQYAYYVRALTTGASIDSDIRTSMLAQVAPEDDAPTDLRVTWNAAELRGETVIGYEIYRTDAQTLEGTPNFANQNGYDIEYADLSFLASVGLVDFYDDTDVNNVTVQYAYYVKAITTGDDVFSNIKTASAVS